MKPTDKEVNTEDYENLVKILLHDGEPSQCGVSPNDMYWLLKRVGRAVLTPLDDSATVA